MFATRCASFVVAKIKGKTFVTMAYGNKSVSNFENPLFMGVSEVFF